MKAKVLITIVALMALAMGASAQNGVISIDNVTNEYSPAELSAGNTHVVSINFDYTALSNANFWNGGNAFEVYSPDGADWGYLQGNSGSMITDPIPAGMDTPAMVFRKHFYYDGSAWAETASGASDPAPGSGGANTRVGFFLTTLDFGSKGATGGVTNGIGVTLEFTTEIADDGKTLCIDTASVLTAWEWVAASAGDFPLWDNGLGANAARCYTIFYDDPQGVNATGTGNLPTKFDLNQNYPNPFNPTTVIKFDLPKAAHATLSVFNVLGQKVSTLVNEDLSANFYEVEWDGTSDGGSQVASGIYFYRLETDENVMTKKMMLLK